MDEQLPEKARIQQLRENMRRDVPGLIARVFALRGRTYRGSGFHWNLEKRVCRLAASLSDFDTKYDGEQAVEDELSFQDVQRSLEAAEGQVPRPPVPPGDETFSYKVVMDTVHHGPKVVARCAAGGDAALVAKLFASHVGEAEVVTRYFATAALGSSDEEFASYPAAHSARNPAGRIDLG